MSTSAVMARSRQLIAATVSALSSWPQLMQRNSAWLLRLPFALHLQMGQVREVPAGVNNCSRISNYLKKRFEIVVNG